MRRRPRELAIAVAEALGYVGVLAVELFVSDGVLLVNELAPRPHNSGHWTLDAAATSQFEQQVRAVCGLTLGATDLVTDAVAMVNLLGDRWAGGEPDWSAAVADRGAHLHLYGKREPRPGRKMGHLTVTAATRRRRRRSCRRAPPSSPPGPDRAPSPGAPTIGPLQEVATECRFSPMSPRRWLVSASWPASVAPMIWLLPGFLDRYYSELPEDDVEHRSADDIYAAAVAHLELGRVRAPGEPIVRVAVT